LGEGFDIGLKYQYKNSNGDLFDVFPKEESRIQLAMIFSIDKIWNNQFDDRGLILNLEHSKEDKNEILFFKNHHQ
jgi:hypothetical protein